MKKYFAKYISVEGEIKEGDKVLCDLDNKKKLRTVKKFNEKHTHFISIEGTSINILDAQKVKLSLCSRGVNSEIFKVMGEISPEATWVKEGDKFDECQFKKIETLCVDREDYYRIKGPCGHFH